MLFGICIIGVIGKDSKKIVRGIMRHYKILFCAALICFSVTDSKAGILTDAYKQFRQVQVRFQLLTSAGNGKIREATVQKFLIDIPVGKRQSLLGEALIYAARFGKTASMKTLIDAGADPNAENEDGRTVLMYAVISGSLEAVKFLTAIENININKRAKLPLERKSIITKNAKGPTALMYACGYGKMTNVENMKISGFKPNPKIVKTLLDAGASPDILDEKYERTSLFYATFFGSYEVVKMLVGNGANPLQTDIQGNNPLNYAVLMYDKAKILKDEEKAKLYSNMLNYYLIGDYKIPQDTGLAKAAYPTPAKTIESK